MLILVRHGQSESNAAGVLVGRSDPPLTELGREQARRAARLLAAERAKSRGPATDDPPTARRNVRVLTSPLGRARATAEVIAVELSGSGVPSLVVDVEDRLIELDYGELEGLRPDEVDSDTWTTWRSDPAWRPPGGESFEQLHARVEPLWAELSLAAASGDVIAVTHVSPVKAAVAWAIGCGPLLAWRLSLGVCSITRIRTSGAAPSLVSFGESGHLIETRGGGGGYRGSDG